MRPFESCRAAWILGACLAWTAAGAWAEPPASPPASPTTAASDPDAALQRALELERQRKWTAAIEVYESALEQWPGRAEFRHRLRLCETHYKLGRRYQDRSFRDVLLRLPRERALDLYDEVLERIETHYVDPVALEPLLRRGFDNLEVALRDPAFLQAHHLGDVPADRIMSLRDTYRAYRDRAVARDRAQARAFVALACDQAMQALALVPSAVVLEFAFGACDALDEYSGYLTPDKLDDLFAMIDGNFVGLGIELKQDEEGLRLVGVIKGGPASEAGLKVGDKITHIGGLAIKGLGLDEAASRLQGAERTAVRITVLKSNRSAIDLTLVRRAVEVQSIGEAKIVDAQAGVGYIQLNGFQKSSTEELRRAVAGLERQGMRHLVLDLRGNPGGLLNVAVEIADRFLDQGVIVSTRGRAPGQSFLYRSRSNPSWRMPMTVLIDHDSASASEILAGALKENRRATVVGPEKSYGKGSVQSIFPLRTAPTGLKLTTAKFYSPSNRAYSEQGVEPDVVVRAAARQTGPEPRSISFGDPLHDPVLDQAIRLARRPVAKAG
jgi:carboxyl-terminal processing protease